MEYFAIQKTFQPDMKHYKVRCCRGLTPASNYQQLSATKPARSLCRILGKVSYRLKRDWFNLNKSYNLFEWSSSHSSQTSGIRVTSLNVGCEGGRGVNRERGGERFFKKPDEKTKVRLNKVVLMRDNLSRTCGSCYWQIRWGAKRSWCGWGEKK